MKKNPAFPSPPPLPLRPLEEFRALIICRGPIAMEAMEVAAMLGMPRPHIVVSKREVFESAESRAPWSEHTHLYEKLHIVDDYRDQDAIVEIARREKLDGIYVGYGYSAERAEFVAKCESAGLNPITTPSSVMDFSGSKFRAKKHVREKLGLRVLPGSDRAAALALEAGTSDEKLLEAAAREVETVAKSAPGSLIRLKAVKSGGGKGQRLIARPDQAAAAVKEIWAEISARGVDGDKGVLVEANLAHPRHWEIQVLSDGETVVHFGGRECSIQNSGSQKFIETSLHPGQYDHYIAELNARKDAALIELLREEQRRIEETCAAAVRIIGSLGYRGAATVEFLVAEGGGPEVQGKPHFMEINSRIQVEHRVSEAISRVRGRNVRLVGEQFRIGAGQKLGYSQEDISLEGYAFEARINASNSSFLIGASGSVIDRYSIPPASESFYYDDGGAVALFQAGRRRAWAIPNFDSNFGLAVFHGATQAEALARVSAGLERFEIRGNAQLKTTRPFHLGVSELLAASLPYPKIRTDFSEIFLALAALVHHALAKLKPSAAAPGEEPLRRLISGALAAFQAEPALAIAFALRERRRRESSGASGAAPVGELLADLARLVQMQLFPEEARAAAAARALPAALEGVFEAVRGAGVFEFRRRAADLELDIPEAVRDPRARAILIDELRDARIAGVAPRPLVAGEIEELREILSALGGRFRADLAPGKLMDALHAALADCTAALADSRALSPAEFDAFHARLRALKWTIRKGGAAPELEARFMAEIQRAMRVVRGPNVVAHLAGTIYLRPSPDKPLYVAVGDEVKEDETVVALLENMKMFNEIRAHMSGRVKSILVENERPVLPGSVIMVIE